MLTVCLTDLREHAVFTLRNLLHGNTENQALVNEIQPMTEWDEEGMLQNRPSALQK
jgi:ataxin-10